MYCQKGVRVVLYEIRNDDQDLPIPQKALRLAACMRFMCRNGGLKKVAFVMKILIILLEIDHYGEYVHHNGVSTSPLSAIGE